MQTECALAATAVEVDVLVTGVAVVFTLTKLVKGYARTVLYDVYQMGICQQSECTEDG